MRDLLITFIVFGAIPFILMRPWIGVLVWSWLGYMNPHRLTWGFAYDYPFSQVTALATLLGVVVSRENKRIPWNGTTVLWVSFILWMNVTTIFALNPSGARTEWDRCMKIQLVILLTLMLMKSRKRIDCLVWTIVVSLGYFGIKGGVFSVLTGGAHRVYGPDLSFIQDNNTLALALVMTLPLMRYLYIVTTRKSVRWGLAGGMALTALSVLTSHSRGALLAMGAMMFFLWLKSKRKLLTGIGLALAVVIALSFMPSHWYERMGTIQTYEEDASAMGRINAWWFAYNLALDRPMVGGGFRAFTPALFDVYAPDPDDFHDAHSIYFEVLGEQGFVGLILFVALGVAAFRAGTIVFRKVRKRDDLQWAGHLAAMLQVSLVGFAAGGAFLGLAYFDLPYHLIALLVLLREIASEDRQADAAAGESERENERSPRSNDVQSQTETPNALSIPS